MNEAQVADAHKVGLRSQDMGGQKRNKKRDKVQTQDEGLAAHDPNEYQKMDQ